MNDLNQLQELLNGSNSVNSGLNGFDVNKLIAWLVIPSIVLTVIICLVFIVSMVQRWRVERAIFEIRDTLREMKLAQQHPIDPKPLPSMPPPAETPEITQKLE